MIAEKMWKRISDRAGLPKLIIGSSLIALIIALGMVGIARLFDFTLNPAIPSAFRAIGAAIFAARTVKQK